MISKNKSGTKISSLKQFAQQNGIVMPRQKDIINEAMTNILKKYKVIGKKTQAKDIFNEFK